ncbi:MAG: Asp-tRNA(Asn)/Glu-tRNA(Gln) amidotransferase subunit GatA [Proteobacteria bacterium]|nr:Asp-tRNA(Asn)/Glu-tRNA(Gln) amidotransferase subunit GatA [Pseudomonadota bacterium]
MSNLLTLTATQALAAMAKGEVSSVELTQAALARMEARKHLGASLLITSQHALQQAEAADKARKAGAGGPLLGLPIGIKDLYCTNGIRTTAASRILENFTPAYESTVTQKLWDAGAINLAKLNMDEFAMGGSNENSAFGPVKNPWDELRISGGSSGGSAAAVADYQCFAATGSDTGGSIRQPAAMCGVVGIKPTYGRCSRWGMVAFASSLDQAGIFARSVEDTALLLQTIAGHDEKDSTSAPLEVPNWVEELQKPLTLKGLKIGLPKEYFVEGLDARVKQAVMNAVKKFEAQGAEIIEVSLPTTEYAVAAYYIVAPAEAASNLARYDGMRYGLRVEGNGLVDTYTKTRTAGFGAEVKRRIMVGNYVLSSGYYDAYYTKAMQARTLIANDFAAAFKKVDVIMAPTAPTPAFKIGEKSADPVAMYLGDAFTIPASLAGLPGISVPAATVEEGGSTLPVGLQIIGNHWQEGKILQVAHAWQTMSGFTPLAIKE